MVELLKKIIHKSLGKLGSVQIVSAKYGVTAIRCNCFHSFGCESGFIDAFYGILLETLQDVIELY